jgi:hypothetical protein
LGTFLQLLMLFVPAVPRRYDIQGVKYSRNAILILAFLMKAVKY